MTRPTDYEIFIYKDHDVWFCTERFTVNGEKVQKTIRCSSRKEALNLLLELQAKGGR